MLAIIAALALAAPSLEAPQLPPIRRDPQITYLDRSGAVIGVRGGRYGPPVDIAQSARLRAGRLRRHRGPPLL